MEGRLVLDHCATLPKKTLSGKSNIFEGLRKGLFPRNSAGRRCFYYEFKDIFEEISQDNHLLLLLLLTSPPSVSLEFFLLLIHPNGISITRHLRHLFVSGFVQLFVRKHSHGSALHKQNHVHRPQI